jgi:Ni,Fe-hydrogenase III component G
MKEYMQMKVLKSILNKAGWVIKKVMLGKVYEVINTAWGLLVCLLSIVGNFYVIDYYGMDYLVSLALCFSIRHISWGIVNFFNHIYVPIINSIVGYFKCVDWYEREIWDMYGIAFNGHPNLSRILTDYGTTFFPLRKYFPLVGFKEIRYDGEYNKIYYSKVFLVQDFRYFDFTSCWV